MKTLVPASDAQSGVGAGGKAQALWLQGGSQWHGSADPVDMETCSRAGRTPRVVSGPVRDGIKPALR